LYFYQEALVRALSVPLLDLDKQLFQNVDPGRKLIILLLSHDIELDGSLLAIIGGKARDHWRDAISVPVAEPPMLGYAYRNVTWVKRGLERLTPLHLRVEVNQAADRDPVVSALHAQLFVCSAVYLAQRSETKGDVWTCTFAADRQETSVTIDAPAMPSKKGWEAARWLGDLACWAYEIERDVDDRLVVVQHTVVDALKNNSDAKNSTELLSLSESLWKRARWGWEAFIGGQLKKYFEQVKALEEAVAATAKDFDEQVSALTKTLTENMLAAVAVVVGSFLAGILKTPFEESAFIVGTSVYAAYLAFFPMLVGLTSTWGRFKNTQANFETRRKSFAQRLGKDQVGDIVKPVLERSEPAFRRWYKRTITVYAAVLVILIVGIVVVPRVTGNPDDFTLKTATPNQPVSGVVTIRGECFDKNKDIIVTLGRATFTNAADSPTLRVYGTTALTFTPDKSDLAAKAITVRQGSAGPKPISLP
jgi:hypothetical protein